MGALGLEADFGDHKIITVPDHHAVVEVDAKKKDKGILRGQVSDSGYSPEAQASDHIAIEHLNP